MTTTKKQVKDMKYSEMASRSADILRAKSDKLEEEVKPLHLKYYHFQKAEIEKAAKSVLEDIGAMDDLREYYVVDHSLTNTYARYSRLRDIVVKRKEYCERNNLFMELARSWGYGEKRPVEYQSSKDPVHAKISDRCDQIDKERRELINQSRNLAAAAKPAVIAKLANIKNDAMKMGVAQYLHDEGIVPLGYWDNYGTKEERDDNKRDLDTMGLGKYVHEVGRDGCEVEYGIGKENLKKALDKLLENADPALKNLENKITKMGADSKKLYNQSRSLINIAGIHSALEEAGLDYRAVKKSLPELLDEIPKTNPYSVAADLENKVTALIYDPGFKYSGTGGSEYGVTVKVMRDGQEVEEYFKWRDAYDASRDTPWKFYKDVKIKLVTDNEVTLELKANDYSPVTKTFTIKRLEQRLNQVALSSKEREEFMKKYEAKKAELLESSYMRGATMPDYVAYRETGIGTTIPSHNVPYDKPEVINKAVDESKGLAAIVIKSQVDHCAGFGKQYMWTGYVIDKDGNAFEVARDNTYENALKQGKRIEIWAKDLLKEYKPKNN